MDSVDIQVTKCPYLRPCLHPGCRPCSRANPLGRQSSSRHPRPSNRTAASPPSSSPPWPPCLHAAARLPAASCRSIAQCYPTQSLRGAALRGVPSAAAAACSHRLRMQPARAAAAPRCNARKLIHSRPHRPPGSPVASAASPSLQLPFPGRAAAPSSSSSSSSCAALRSRGPRPPSRGPRLGQRRTAAH